MPHRIAWIAAWLLLEGLAHTVPPASAPLDRSSPEPTLPETYRFYLGTGGADAAIYAFRFDAETGAIALEGETPGLNNPTFLALSSDRQTLYAVQETGDAYPEEGAGAVHAFRVGPDGGLTFLNRQSSGGPGPCYVSVDQTGRYVLAANYVGGSVVALPVEADGRLGPASDVVQHEGAGPNSDRQEAPHAHYAQTGPGNRHVFVADLGIDQVRVYTLDAETGRLAPAAVPAVEAAPGAGPRHLDFHPNGRFAYLVNELNSTVTAFAYDAETGGLEERQTLSILPDGFDGTSYGADIHVHPNGRFLYASNRGFDSIAVLRIDAATGRLELVGQQNEGVAWPRNFAVDPSGRFLLVANQQEGTLTVHRIDPETGALSITEHRVDVPQPMCIRFIAPTAGS